MPLSFVFQHALFSYLTDRSDEVETGKGEATVRGGQRANALASEVRLGRSLLESAAGRELAQLARQQSELILRFPRPVLPLSLHDPDAPYCDNTESTGILFLLKVRF